MISGILKRLAACLPPLIQHELKCLHYRRQILTRCFKSDEPEYSVLDFLLSPGDWAIDIGANIGQYSRRFSDLVGPEGRVVAIEPVTETFSLLAANAGCFPHNNVTLLNMAASDEISMTGMNIPCFKNGLKNYYEACLCPDGGACRVMSFPIDALHIPFPVQLVKIDVEGHELAVLAGMQKTIQNYHPIIIMEKGSLQAVHFLEKFDYRCHDLDGSPNHLMMADRY